jgi:hypothetical protein
MVTLQQQRLTSLVDRSISSALVAGMAAQKAMAQLVLMALEMDVT